MTDLSDVIEQVRELGNMMDADGIPASHSYLSRLDSILADLEALRDSNALAISALAAIRAQPNCRYEVEAQLGEEVWIDQTLMGDAVEHQRNVVTGERRPTPWPEDHGHYIGVPVADDPDRQE